jgi:hypothetical protein
LQQNTRGSLDLGHFHNNQNQSTIAPFPVFAQQISTITLSVGINTGGRELPFSGGVRAAFITMAGTYSIR